MEVGLQSVESYKLSVPRPLAGTYLGQSILFWKLDLFFFFLRKNRYRGIHNVAFIRMKYGGVVV
jgi:hypothetical protein